MGLRRIGLIVGAMALSAPATAGEMTLEQARDFVVGKTFAYTCFDGSRGAGRINGDGSRSRYERTVSGASCTFRHTSNGTMVTGAPQICLGLFCSRCN